MRLPFRFHQGDPRRVVDAYLTYVAGGEEALLARDSPAARATPASEEPAAVHGYREGRWGSREVEITSVRLLDDRGRVRHVYVPGESLTLSLGVRAAQEVRDFVFGVGLFTADGVQVYGTNTHLEDYVPEAVEGTGRLCFVIEALHISAIGQASHWWRERRGCRQCA